MRGRGRVAAAAVFVALTAAGLLGCSAQSTADTPGTGASSADCDVVGVEDGVDVNAFAVELADGKYPLRGNTVIGTADGEPVADVRFTVAGDGFSKVLCTDADGKWGAVLPAAAPYTITLASAPEGLEVTRPQVDADGAFTVPAQSVYPATVSVFFQKTEGDGADPEPGTAGPAGEGVCSSYFDALTEDPTVLDVETLDPAAYSSPRGIPVPTPDCAVRVEQGGNNITFYLGWESTSFDEVHEALLAGGLTDYQPWENETSRKYMMTTADGAGLFWLDSGEGINTGIPVDHVLFVYAEG
jgi:hypothetical protein